MAQASEKNILVVDDEPDVRNFLAACIEDAGYNVETAVDGVDAMEKIKANPPDLMTLDMVMPRKSGIRLMRDLKQDEELNKIPVIVITAHARDELGSDDIKEFNAFATRQRPKCVMEKPITPEKLVKTIGDILGVDVEETVSVSDVDQIKNMLNVTDRDTLNKIKSLLGDKS